MMLAVYDVTVVCEGRRPEPIFIGPERITFASVYEPIIFFMDTRKMPEPRKSLVNRRWADPAFREMMRERRTILDTRSTGARRRPTRVWWHKGDIETLAPQPPAQDWKRGRKPRATTPT